MGGMGTAWRESTRVPALRVPVLLMGLGEAARALGQPSEASTPSEPIALDLSAARRPPHKNSAAESTEAGKRGRSHGESAPRVRTHPGRTVVRAAAAEISWRVIGRGGRFLIGGSTRGSTRRLNSRLTATQERLLSRVESPLSRVTTS
jgi:hypothetical protein